MLRGAIISEIIFEYSEAVGQMAAVAVRTKTAFVRIITSMTGDTGGRLLRCRSTGRMAVGADEIFVSTCQLEAGKFFMVKQPVTPTRGVVAAFALGPHGAIVDVIRGMTIRAGVRERRVNQRIVTLLASHNTVQTDQGEFCQVMMEALIIEPVRLAVTGATFIEGACMWII